VNYANTNKTKIPQIATKDDPPRLSTKGSEQVKNNINMEAYQAYYNTNEAGAAGKNEA